MRCYVAPAWERWDEFSSADSDPIGMLRRFVAEEKAATVRIPLDAWAALVVHPLNRDAFVAAETGTFPDVVEKAIGAAVEVTGVTGPVVIGDGFELRDVLDETRPR